MQQVQDSREKVTVSGEGGMPAVTHSGSGVVMMEKALQSGLGTCLATPNMLQANWVGTRPRRHRQSHLQCRSVTVAVTN